MHKRVYKHQGPDKNIRGASVKTFCFRRTSSSTPPSKVPSSNTPNPGCLCTPDLRKPDVLLVGFRCLTMSVWWVSGARNPRCRRMLPREVFFDAREGSVQGSYLDLLAVYHSVRSVAWVSQTFYSDA